MRYIIGDIHGCYDKYMALLKKISFDEEDELYILGDAMDRGPEPIKVLQDIMNRPNVIYILGNHDLAFYLLMKKLCVEITEDNVETQIDMDLLNSYQEWLEDGGKVTADQFRRLNMDEKNDILSFLEEASAYEIIEHEHKTYVLVHGGLGQYELDKEPWDCSLAELVEDRADYSRPYYTDKNRILVTGHTPTSFIQGWEKPRVYQANSHIAMDCGCVGTGVLAAFCVETEEVIYA